MSHTARYGTGALYGESGLVYGAKTVTRKLTWMLEVDWDGDAIFNGENEGGKIFAMEVENGRQFYMKSDASGPEPVQNGKVSLSLRNLDGRYDPFKATGPLYGQILPGRKFRLRVQKEPSGSREPIMTGTIEDLRPIYGATDTVKMTLVNAVSDLKGTEIRTGVNATIRFDDAIKACLTAFGWTDGLNIDITVSETMAYWWAAGRDAFQETLSIVDAALGMFCIAEDGLATYKSRISGESPLLTLLDADAYLDYGIRTPTPWDTIRNDIRVYARARLPQTNVELWRSNDTLLILPGESKPVWAEFSIGGEEAVATVVTTPVATTDYTFNSASDGSGTNLTGDISISLPASNVFATAAKMTITNNGATPAYRTLLKMRGNAIVADKFTFVEGEDAVSIAKFKRRKYSVKSDWLQDVNTALDERDILLSRLATQRQFPRIKIKDDPDKQFALRIFGLVTANFVGKGITGEYRVGYYKHRWLNEGGDEVETELFLEPNLLGNVTGTWVFPTVFPTKF